MGTHEEVNEMNGSLILVTCLLFLILRGRHRCRLHRVFGGFESLYYYAGNLSGASTVVSIQVALGPVICE